MKKLKYLLIPLFSLLFIISVKANTIQYVGYDNEFDVYDIIVEKSNVLDNIRDFLLDRELITESDVLISLDSWIMGSPNPIVVGKIGQDIQLNSSNTSVYFSNYWCLQYDSVTGEVSYSNGYCGYYAGINLTTPEYIGYQAWWGGDENTTLTITNNVTGYDYILDPDSTTSNFILESGETMNLYDFVNDLKGGSQEEVSYTCHELGMMSDYKQLTLRISGRISVEDSLEGFFMIMPGERYVEPLDSSLYDIEEIYDTNTYSLESSLTVENNVLNGYYYKYYYKIENVAGVEFPDMPEFEILDISQLVLLEFASNTSNTTSYQVMQNAKIVNCVISDGVSQNNGYGAITKDGGTISKDPTISNYLQNYSMPTDLNFLQKLKTIFPQGPVDSILNLPLTMLNSIKTSLEGTCQPIQITLPYVNRSITLNCQNTFYSNIGLTNFVNTVGVFASTLMLFQYFIFLYNWVDDVLKLSDTEVKAWGTGEVK